MMRRGPDDGGGGGSDRRRRRCRRRRRRRRGSTKWTTATVGRSEGRGMFREQANNERQDG